MKMILLVIGMLLVAACTATRASAPADLEDALVAESEEHLEAAEMSPPKVADLPDLGRAPEMENETWLNTDRPLRLADLRGRVVLLDMWTFG